MSIGDHGHVDREWRDRWDEAVSSICRGISGEMVVIGEETQIKGLGWELPRELWASSLVLISKARACTGGCGAPIRASHQLLRF